MIKDNFRSTNYNIFLITFQHFFIKPIGVRNNNKKFVHSKSQKNFYKKKC